MSIFKKKPKADFSSVQSGSASTTPAQTPPPAAGAHPAAAPPQAAGAERTREVVSGDTLSKIAQQEYGEASKWKVIYEANRDRISDPDRIQPGQLLRIPSAE